MSEARFESPLAGQPAPQGLSVSLSEIVERGMIDLRGDAGDPAFASAVESVLGLALPREPRSSRAAGEVSVLWLSLDQWLVQCPRTSAADLARDLAQALTGVHALVVDMSDARAIIRLEGEGAREVLMKGTPVDLTGPAFAPGTVRRVRFAEIAALAHMVSESPDVIELYVFRSYAVFAWQWLVATAGRPAQIRLFAPQSAPLA